MCTCPVRVGFLARQGGVSSPTRPTRHLPANLALPPQPRCRHHHNRHHTARQDRDCAESRPADSADWTDKLPAPRQILIGAGPCCNFELGGLQFSTGHPNNIAPNPPSAPFPPARELRRAKGAKGNRWPRGAMTGALAVNTGDKRVRKSWPPKARDIAGECHTCHASEPPPGDAPIDDVPFDP